MILGRRRSGASRLFDLVQGISKRSITEFVTWRGYGRSRVRQPGDNCPWERLLLWIGASLFFGGAAAGIARGQTPEEHAIEAIRATAVSRPTEIYPLPLAASWNDGSVATGFGPPYQIEQIRAGRYLLPWFYLRPPPADDSPTESYAVPSDAMYYESAIRYLAQHRLPLSFESTQFESILRRLAPEYARTGPDGKPLPLSPFDPIEPWYAAGREWAHQGALRRLQELYPDPPLVLFVSNNEQAKMSPRDLHAAAGPTADADTTARRRAIGDAWIERYRALLRGFRDGLTPAWRAHALLIGYEAFVTPAMGRWPGWMEYCLYVPGRTDPWAYAWDGASVSFYVHDWAPDSDYTVWSPQIESMNWVAEREQVARVKPFWFEISTWDGQQPGKDTDKRYFYAERGQELTPRRYGGMVQFGMWLLRPRAVREFRNPEHDRIRFGAYFDTILAAVTRVHDNPVLSDFWQHGRLLPNPGGGHPYVAALPPELAARPRWFLLDAAANPSRPWELPTPLKVFSIALERGRKPGRQWLIYAYCPQDEALDTDVQIPGARVQRVHALRGGSFTLVTESDGKSRPIE